MITIFLGDITEQLADTAKLTDPLAVLITSDNYNNLTHGTYYVSRGDLKSELELFKTLNQADSIIYSPPPIWSDADKHNASQMQRISEDVLAFFLTTKKIKNFQIEKHNNLDHWTKLIDQRKSSGPQLWSVGCSITAGVGVDLHERYGQLLADTLKLPVSFLASSGSSVIWQADQILRSDIRPGDLIVWGILSLNRFPYYVNNDLAHVNITSYTDNRKNIQQYVDISTFDSENLMYRTITDMYKVINFCNKIGATLIVSDFGGNKFQQYFPDFQNIVHAYWTPWNNMPDKRGNDGSHPGAIVHEFYHDAVMEKLLEI